MATIDPRHGGSVEAGRLLSAGLIKQGHNVEAVSLDRPGNDWQNDWPCLVHELGPSYTPYMYCPALLPWLRTNVGRFDALLVHNLYRYISYGVWRIACEKNTSYYVFTHGMLDPWFKHAHPIKHLKKTLFWTLVGSKILKSARAVLYTCEDEKTLARSSFYPYDCTEQVVGLGICDPSLENQPDTQLVFERFPHLKNESYILFLGRVTAKKGLDLLIDGFAEVYGSEIGTNLVIAGDGEKGLQERLAALPSAQGLGDRLVWTGHLSGELKWSAIARADAMALFSHSENFAISVSEALALSVPVLITDKVNIWREISHQGAGFIDSDDLDGAKRLLSRWRSTPVLVKDQMRSNARLTFQQHFEIGETVRRLEAELNDHVRSAPAI